MATPELAPRRTAGGVIAVWVVAALAGIAVGLFVQPDARPAWLAVALGGCLVLALGIQLAYGRSQGFIGRMAASILGALFVMGVISLGYGLATVVPG